MCLPAARRVLAASPPRSGRRRGPPGGGPERQGRGVRGETSENLGRTGKVVRGFPLPAGRLPALAVLAERMQTTLSGSPWGGRVVCIRVASAYSRIWAGRRPDAPPKGA